MRSLLLALLFLATATSGPSQDVPAHLREAAKDLSKSYTINYDETRKIVLNLPEGYLMRRMPKQGEDVVLCPWNEFFLIDCGRYPAGSGKPVKDEPTMNAELDVTLKAYADSGGVMKERKVWVTPTGVLGSAEVWVTTGKKKAVTSVLLCPVKSEIWAFRLTGQESALADQKVIQQLIVQELAR